MTSSTRSVAKARPKAMEVAMGIRNWAWKEVSNNSGVRPAMVVSEVSKTARRRWQEASTKASVIPMPWSRSRL